MSQGSALDVSGLPDHAFGTRDSLWWGVTLLMVIEGTVTGLALMSYFYVRGNYRVWPPVTVGSAALTWASAGLAVLVASIAPMVMVQKTTRRYDLQAARRWMVWASLLSLVALPLRACELAALPFRWSTSAYGSVVWIAIGLHTLHVVAGAIENVLLTVLAYFGPFEPKHHVDLDLNAWFWLFVVAEWAVLYGVLYGEAVLGA